MVTSSRNLLQLRIDYENSDMAYQEREDLRQYALEREQRKVVQKQSG